MLMHHRDAGLDRVRGRPASYVFAIDAHRTIIGRIHATQDAHQRRFARPVFTNQCMDFGGAYLQTGAAICLNRAKRLVDVLRVNGPLHGAHLVDGTLMRPATISCFSCSTRSRTAGAINARLLSSYTYPTPPSAKPNE